MRLSSLLHYFIIVLTGLRTDLAQTEFRCPLASPNRDDATTERLSLSLIDSDEGRFGDNMPARFSLNLVAGRLGAER
jgi:hypothetical protein